MTQVATQLDSDQESRDDSSRGPGANGMNEPGGQTARKVSKSNIYRLALVLAVIAVCLYGLSIVSIIHTRGAG